VDSGGAFLPAQAEIFADRDMGGRSFHNQAIMSALGIPQVCLVHAVCLALSDATRDRAAVYPVAF